MTKMSVLAIALTVALAYGTAEATVFVVDPTPPACVQPSGGVLVPTIGAAVTAAAAGDRIYVCPGTYPENVVVQPTQSNLTLLGIGRPLVVPGDPTQPGFLILASGVRIQGFEVAGFQFGQYTCAIAVGSPAPLPPQPSGVIVLANVVHDNALGICFSNAGGNEARDNTADRNSFGIVDASFGPPVTSNLLIGNRARRNLQMGIALFNKVSTRVDMNEVSENEGVGIMVQDVDGGVISRNTVVKNSYVGIDAQFGSRFKLDHNTVRENFAFGIRVFNAGDCAVDENTVARNGKGIHVESASSCQFYRNVVQQNVSIGIDAVSLGSGDVFIFNTASGNRILDCSWDGSDAPTFADNRCGTEVPAGAWD